MMRAAAVLLSLGGALAMGAAPHLDSLSRTGTHRAGRAELVSGDVFDSVSQAPLALAEVQMLGDGDAHRSYSARTDARGRFSIGDAEPGTYLVGVFHPHLDSLGIEVPTRRVTVASGAATPLALAVPSRQTILRARCPAGTRVDSSSTLVHGLVRDARTRASRGGAVVVAQWTELTLNKTGLARQRMRGVMTTSDDGAFALCNAPNDVDLSLRVAQGGDTSGVIVLRFGSELIVGHDVYLGPSQPIEDPTADSVLGVAMRARRGGARLVGTVRATTGRPLANARVSVWGTPADATTDADGAFAMSGLPAGTYTLEARAIGFEPTQVAVDLLLEEQGPNLTTVVLEPHRPAMDTVRVIASLDLSLIRSGFESRRRSGMGHFIDRAALDRQQPLQTTSAIAMLPGVMVRPYNRGRAIIMHDTRGDACTPTVYIDANRYDPHHEHDGFVAIDELIDPERIAGMEVYTRLSQAPLEFGGTTKDGCGSVVIWTKSMVPRKKR